MTEDLALFSMVSDDDAGDASDVADLQTAAGLLALKDLPKVGNGRAIKLATAFRSIAALNESNPSRRQAVAGVPVDYFFSAMTPRVPDGTRLVGYFDSEYPESLRAIPNPPAVLWVMGELPDPARRIAIVGTRSATQWGRQMAKTTAGAAAQSGITVVSGLALGIDIAAHRAAIASGGVTIAVLGSGIDNVTPHEHRADAEAILAGGGCLIAEVDPGIQPSPRTLVARNRIQSGLSSATVIVQCGMKSGTMTTAKFTVDQGRLLALPVPPESERADPENAGSAALATQAPRPRLLEAQGDLAALLAEIV